jgi:hypothetical protein
VLFNGPLRGRTLLRVCSQYFKFTVDIGAISNRRHFGKPAAPVRHPLGASRLDMKTTLILIFFFYLGHFFGQDSSSAIWTKRVDSLRQKNKLTVKQYPDKTFVGSLTGYYFSDSLVFINTLTDAEEAGTETQYYVKNGSLVKVYIMAARFDSSAEWTGYYSKHNKNLNCRDCHSKPQCERTEIIYSSPISVKYFNKTKKTSHPPSDNKVLADKVTGTYKQLLTLLKDL